MTTVTIDNAKTDLASLIERALNGEEIVIIGTDLSSVRLAPVIPASNSYRGRGILKGKIRVSDSDLFDPLPDDELKLWNGEGN